MADDRCWITTDPIDGWEDRTALLLGLVIGAAGLGNTLGILVASLAKKIKRETLQAAAR